MLYNKQGHPLITISEALKIIEKSEGEEGNFDTQTEGFKYVVDHKIYPEITKNDTAYYKASQLGISDVDAGKK